jgi:hypothetical protein
MTWNAMRVGLTGRRRRTHGRWPGMALAALAVVVSIVACNTERLLDVNAPDRVPASTLDDPAQAGLLVNGAVADFECAYASYALVEGIISDEFADAQLGAAGWPYDRRDANTHTDGIYGTGSCSSNQNPGVYTPLSTARWDADNALTHLQGWTDAQVGSKRTALIAKAALYAGFSYTALGMSMCEAAFDLSAPIDQTAMFAKAEDRFTTAIDAATKAGGEPDIINAALVGRARVRLFEGNASGAAADAQQVPAGFELDATYDGNSGRRYNRIFASTAQYGFYTVDSASRALTTEGVLDPRSATVYDAGTGSADHIQKIYSPAKYSGDASPIPIASYVEAQLILAEAEGGSQAVTIINALRDQYSLPHYMGPTDSASITQLIINERQRALFAEGFRNYDIQRFNVPLVPAPGTAYPDKGGTYGNTTCLPLPDIEKFNNPNAG